MPSPVDRVIRSARRRLLAHALLGQLAAGWAVALAAGLAWFLAEPPLLDSRPGQRWWVLGLVVGVATLVAVSRAFRSRPTRLAVALEVDARFRLRERVTSAVALSPEERAAPVGAAVVADAERHTTGLQVGDRFPVRVPRSARRVLLLAVVLAVVAFGYHPVTDSPAWTRRQQELAATVTGSTPPSPSTPAETPPPPVPDRPDPSPRVKELRDELDRLARQARQANPDTAKELAAAADAAEQKARALERETFDRLARLETTFRQLDALNTAENFKDGPATPLNEALSRGDLDTTRERLELLAEQLRNTKLDPQEAKKAAEQLEQMRQQLDRAERKPDQDASLREMVEQAKKEGRDPGPIEKEREQTRQQQPSAAGDLAKKLDAAAEALRGGKPQDAAKQLDAAGNELEKVQGSVRELQDARQQARRAEELRTEAGQPAGKDSPGNAAPSKDGGNDPAGKNGSGDGPGKDQPGNVPGGKSPPGSGGIGAGRRPRTPEPQRQTGSVDARVRTPFDPSGSVNYAGGRPGNAFSGATPAEVGAALPRARQRAADEVAGQPVGPDDKAAVREFFADPKR